jgi:ribosomal subunit interface protein
MQVPLELAFHNMEQSDQIQSIVSRQVERLERFSDEIVHCRVAVEARHKQPHKSTLGINLEVSVPGDVIVAKRETRPHEVYDHNDAYGVIQDTFDAAIKQLETYKAKRRHRVKTHEQGLDFGRIVRLDVEREHGFIEASGGNNVFFHRDVVEEGEFHRLEEGVGVYFSMSPSEGPYGPQARLVRVVNADHVE